MGMDLIGTGFTVDTSRKCDLEALDTLIDGFTNEQIDDKFLNEIDPSGGYFDYTTDSSTDFFESVRNTFKEGAREYNSTCSGHRHTVEYNIPETSLWFIFAGGGSWGDDPYDGWGVLSLFVNLCEADLSIAYLAGFVSGGLPHPNIINGYHRNNEGN